MIFCIQPNIQRKTVTTSSYLLESYDRFYIQYSQLQVRCRHNSLAVIMYGNNYYVFIYDYLPFLILTLVSCINNFHCLLNNFPYKNISFQLLLFQFTILTKQLIINSFFLNLKSIYSYVVFIIYLNKIVKKFKFLCSFINCSQKRLNVYDK